MIKKTSRYQPHFFKRNLWRACPYFFASKNVSSLNFSFLNRQENEHLDCVFRNQTRWDWSFERTTRLNVSKGERRWRGWISLRIVFVRATEAADDQGKGGIYTWWLLVTHFSSSCDNFTALPCSMASSVITLVTPTFRCSFVSGAGPQEEQVLSVRIDILKLENWDHFFGTVFLVILNLFFYLFCFLCLPWSVLFSVHSNTENTVF